MNFAIKYILVWLVAVFCFAFVSCDQKPVQEQAQPSIPSVINKDQYVTPIPTPKPVEINFTQKDDVKLQELPSKQPPQESLLSKLSEKVEIKGPGATVGETKSIKEVNPPILTAEIVTPKKVVEKPVIVEKVVAPVSRENLQAKIINVASKYVGETESEGNNRSPFIDKINKFAGNVPLGSPYCASFVSWVLYEAGVPNAPRSAWSPAILAKNNVLFDNIKSADCFGLYFSNLKRIGHTGFIKNPNYNSSSISTIEANTSFTSVEGSAADREGTSGVVSKLRNKKLMSNPKNKFSRYW
jgi:hypothetical protein